MTFATRDALPARRGADRQALGGDGGRGGRAGGRARRGASAPMPAALTSATGSWTAGSTNSSERWRTGRRLALRFHRWLLRHPNLVYVGGITAGTAAALAPVFLVMGPVGARRLARGAARLAAAGVRHRGERDEPARDRVPAAARPPEARLPAARRAGGRAAPPWSSRRSSPTWTPWRTALANLEVQYLANRDDAPALRRAQRLHRRRRPSIARATTRSSRPRSPGVRALNARHAPASARRLLPLPPAAPVERAAGRLDGMGAEARQAGAVQPLPARRGARTRSPRSRGAPRRSRGVRYVITLDSDTVLPPDEAPALIGAIAHPLNRAVYDRAPEPRGGGLRHPAAARRGLARERAHVALRRRALGTSRASIPYTTAVSDVYQDLYGEGSFTGKGIYDVDAFETATHGRFPENTLLSHDLIEGNFARAGLVTDIAVFDDYPGALPLLLATQAPLDPRRLAAAALAHAVGAGSAADRSATGSASSRAGRSSTTCGAARWRLAQFALHRRGVDAAPRLAAPLDPARGARRRGALDRAPAPRADRPLVGQVAARLLRRGRAATR